MPAPNTTQNFWRRIAVGGPDECWEWQGFRNKQGYGHAGWQGRSYLAHRLAYEIHHGVSLAQNQSEGRTIQCVCHTCDNPPCCNPSHLWIGTLKDNNRDRHDKGRSVPIPPVPQERQIRGERHHQSKLTEQDVIGIYERLASGEAPSSIFKDFAVSVDTIRYIAKRKLWKHLTHHFDEILTKRAATCA